MKEFRKTKSVCPECLTKIDARLVEEKNKLYLLKKCRKHGIYKVLISKDPKNYKKINNFYLALNDKEKYKNYPRMHYNLFVTPNCTFNCRGCLSKKRGKEIKLPEIKKIIKKFKNTKIAVWGGEATLRKDLPQIIKLIQESGNTPALYTDGIKISNYKYLKELKQNGLKIVHLEFEGFEKIIPKIKNPKKIIQKKIIQKKIKALANLKRLNIATGIQSTIVKGINENCMMGIIDYAVKNDFVKNIFFKSHRYFCKSTLPLHKRLTTSELLELIEEQTQGKVQKDGIQNCQVAMYLLSDILNKKRCFYNRSFLLLRENNSYIPITKIFNFDKIQKKLYSCINIKNKILRKIMMLIKIIPDILNFKAIPIYSTLFSMFVSNRILNKRFDSTKLNYKIIYITLGRMCDSYNFDFANAQNCEQGEILDDGKVISSLGVSDLFREKEKNCSEISQLENQIGSLG